MKKTLLFVIVTVCCLQISLFAQKSRVGVFGGLSTSNMDGQIDGLNIKGSSLHGYSFGMLVDIPLGKTKFSFQPTIQYAQKGKTIAKSNDSKTYLALRYAEMLLNIMYNWRGKNGDVFIGVGPAIAQHLPSLRVIKSGDVKAETGIVFGDDPISDYRALDYGAHFVGGIRCRKGYFLSANYTLGIRNMLPGDVPDKLTNGCFTVKLGILVNNK